MSVKASHMGGVDLKTAIVIWFFCIVFFFPWGLPAAEAEEPMGTVTVETEDLNVRSGPGLHYDIVSTLNKGEQYRMIEKEKDWIQIQLKDEKLGWVADYLVTIDREADESTTTFNPATLRILHNGTNIRQNPSTQDVILERANEGDTYEAIQLKDDWYQIKLSNGDTGYVASWIVSEIGSDSSTRREQRARRDSLKRKTIVIDPGHGGEDGGTVGKNGTLEKRLTLQTATYLREKLESAGANVIVTRDNDFYLTLTSRVETGYDKNADAFISLHFDSSKDHSVRGLTTYFYHSWQKELAVELHAAAVDQTKQEDRGVRFGDYYVIRENNKKAVLIELGYLSNPSEELLVRSDEYQKSAATGIYEGLERYFNH